MLRYSHMLELEQLLRDKDQWLLVSLKNGRREVFQISTTYTHDDYLVGHNPEGRMVGYASDQVISWVVIDDPSELEDDDNTVSA